MSKELAIGTALLALAVFIVSLVVKADKAERDSLDEGAKVEATTKDIISGEWVLFLGKSVNRLNLENDDGVITGNIIEDDDWGGESFTVKGMIVDGKVNIYYTTVSYSGGRKSTVTHSLKGKITGKKMSGSRKITGAFGVADSLWVAKKK